ncbi:homocysteine S-methyltransferase family protein [bacterium]|nr:homocysteine S-methyltransferase family protein [bacterium]
MSELFGLIRSRNIVLTEGAFFDRYKRIPGVKFDDFAGPGCGLYDQASRQVIQEIHGEYLQIARDHQLPALLLADTWRANRERTKKSGLPETINQDAVNLLLTLEPQKNNFFIAGQIGPRGDCYSPEVALTREESRDFHEWQVRELSQTKIDILLISTFPALGEAQGVADLAAKYSIPYLVSFVVRRAGTLLDGTPLDQAFRAIEATQPAGPVGLYCNCTHPRNLLEALARYQPEVGLKIAGFQGNVSRLEPEEFATSDTIQSDDFSDFIQAVLELRKKYKIPIIGGCCGTDGKHLAHIAEGLKQSPDID